MSGITTSETLRGEQPKDDDLPRRLNDVGGRLTELLVEMRQTKPEVREINSRIDNLFDKVLVISEGIEKLDKEFFKMSQRFGVHPPTRDLLGDGDE
jgi:predicted nucleotidyltransferase